MSSQPSAKAQPPASDAKMMTQAKVTTSLQQAGFKDVQILDESFLVQAKTADGTPVVMMINPPSETAGSGSSNSTSPPTGSDSSNGANGKSMSGQPKSY
jgi:hypothetical protein